MLALLRLSDSLPWAGFVPLGQRWQARFRAIVELELLGDLAKAFLGLVGARATQKYVADYLIDAMKAYLTKAGLA